MQDVDDNCIRVFAQARSSWATLQPPANRTLGTLNSLFVDSFCQALKRGKHAGKQGKRDIALELKHKEPMVV